MPKGDKNSGGKKNPEKKIGRTAQDEGFEFGVNEMADHLGIEPASVRVKLRAAGIQKQGAVYGWKSEKAMKEDAKKLSAGRERSEEKSSKKGSKEQKGSKSSKDEGSRKQRRDRDEGAEARE